MKKNKKMIIKIILSVLLVGVAICSMTSWAGKYSSPDTYKDTLAVLNEKQTNVMTLTAASTAASVAITILPEDNATPIAEQITEISTYLLLISCVIFVEKFMLTLSGLANFAVIVPIACALIIIWLYTNYHSLLQGAIKLIVVGTLLMGIVPLSVVVTNIIEDTHQINMESIDESLKFEEGETEEEGLLSFFENVADSVTGLPERAQKLMTKFVDTVAVMLVTSCVIPVGVFLCYFAIAKSIFSFKFEINDFQRNIQNNTKKLYTKKHELLESK